MRLKGKLSIVNNNVDSKYTLVLEIPFQNMPMYPSGTELYLHTTDKKVYLEQVKICSYMADTEYGTTIDCEDNGVTSLFRAIMGLPDCLDDGNGLLTYKGLVDFSAC